MPSAVIPPVSTSFSLFPGGLRRIGLFRTALPGWGRRLSDAWFREPPRDATQSPLKATRLQREELAAMSAHELNDLGIGRSEIPALLGDRPGWRSGRL